ncbi:MAG: hypothetical protein HYT69_02125 [Candidatus Zambryskibacteria bacterium]|nr:hypothetical protein [Candidatus Zambryskibacteria bacterium]
MEPQTPVYQNPVPQVQSPKPLDSKKSHKILWLTILALLIAVSFYLTRLSTPSIAVVDHTQIESISEEILARNFNPNKSNPTPAEIEAIKESVRTVSKIKLPKILSKESINVDQLPADMSFLKSTGVIASSLSANFQGGAVGFEAVFKYESNLIDTFSLYKSFYHNDFYILKEWLVDENLATITFEKSGYLFRIVIYPSANNSTEAVIIGFPIPVKTL